MPRAKSPVRSISKLIRLPEDIVARLELELYSPAEGRVPQGAQQDLFMRLLKEHFEKLDAARGIARQPALPAAVESAISNPVSLLADEHG